MKKSHYPVRNRMYRTRFFDSSRWDHFVGRRGDVFICTPPKCGTTWTQAISLLLLLGWDNFSTRISDVSPWYDAVHSPLEQTNLLLNSLKHRRCIKTHTPLDGIPYSRDSTYITVYRDPRDVYFSMQNHINNMCSTLSGAEIPMVSVSFQEWVLHTVKNDEQFRFSLDSIVSHYLSYKRFSHADNIHFLHYSTMKQNPKAAVLRIAQILGISINNQGLDSVIKQSSFGHMSRNADQFAPDVNLNLWKENKSFFAKGKNAQWCGRLSDIDLAIYATRIQELLQESDAAWISRGV